MYVLRAHREGQWSGTKIFHQEGLLCRSDSFSPDPPCPSFPPITPLRLFLSILICQDFRRPRLSTGPVGHCSIIMDSSRFTSLGIQEVLHCFEEPEFREGELLFSMTGAGFSFIMSSSSSDMCTYHSVSMVKATEFIGVTLYLLHINSQTPAS